MGPDDNLGNAQSRQDHGRSRQLDHLTRNEWVPGPEFGFGETEIEDLDPAHIGQQDALRLQAAVAVE